MPNAAADGTMAVMSTPLVTLIAAMTRNRVIGASGSLPWQLPADMRHFVAHTRGKPVVMGRRNHDDIGRALPKRHNIVMSRDPAFTAPGCTVAGSAESALAAAGDVPEVMIIGGAEIYALFLPRARRIELTVIDTELDGDTRFPALEAGWRVVDERHRGADADNPWPLTFQRLERD
ncbi:Dihydrofolate reductase type 3 [wastewater metagenome]|uniref:dihydrofolate reductase n=3 Tax=root TaxID=1 RepID=A0A5B8RGG4_9ZZZZ|nr:dihydrofolate reductase type 3 [uncultured organism]